MGANTSATIYIFLTPEGACLKPITPEEKAMEKVAVFSLMDLRTQFDNNHITTVLHVLPAVRTQTHLNYMYKRC